LGGDCGAIPGDMRPNWTQHKARENGGEFSLIVAELDTNLCPDKGFFESPKVKKRPAIKF
jgi:hypothetical protein